MVNSILRDQRRRFLLSKLELKRVQYRALLQNTFSPIIKKEASIYLHKIPRNSSKTRIKNRCILTGRGRSVLRVCKMSRIRFRELASQGLLNGIVKASW